MGARSDEIYEGLHCKVSLMVFYFYDDLHHLHAWLSHPATLVYRFGHGTSKNAKQAQSKEKVLQKMVRAGLVPKPEQEKLLNFNFPDPGHLPPPVLAFHDVTFGYPKCEPLYDNVNFGVDLDSRVALVGPNGAGKTTLVKLMTGELLPTLGDIRPHGHLKMGRFTQHFVDVLDLTLTPLEFFGNLYPGIPREELRKYLGRFGVSGKMQVQKMEELSDGQKSRVVFSKLGKDVPHILCKLCVLQMPWKKQLAKWGISLLP
jgi:ATP-binding cassette subfamily F protein 2